MNRRQLRAIAGVEALDGLRARRQLVVRALTPVLLFGAVLVVTLALRGSDTAIHPEPYRIAVEGDLDGARATLTALNPARLVFVPSADARLAAIDDADAGMRVPDGLDALLAGPATTDPTDPADPADPTGAPSEAEAGVPVEVYQVTTRAPSRAAAVLVQSGFVDLRSRDVAARVAVQEADARAGSFSITSVNVERTTAGTRSLAAQVVPGLICLQAAMLVAGTANRLVSRRTRGVLTAQLLLPVSRRALAFGKGMGELVVGLVTAAPVVAAVLVFGALTAAATSTAPAAVVQVLASIVAMVPLFALTTLVGVWIGTAARTQEQVSLATGAAVVVAALVATVVAVSPVSPPAVVAVVPFAGLVAALRNVLDGTGQPLAFVVAMASTVAGTLAVAALSGRALDAERLVTRNG